MPITHKDTDVRKLEQPRAMIDRAHILSEIRRNTAENGGSSPGHRRFATETGIKESAWRGKYWSKWSDALAEAGFAPNEKQQPYDKDYLLSKLAAFVAELGRIPVMAELRMKAHSDRDFPSDKTWRKLGSKAAFPTILLDYCSSHPEFHHLREVCRESIGTPQPSSGIPDAETHASKIGFVYLSKFRSDF